MLLFLFSSFYAFALVSGGKQSQHITFNNKNFSLKRTENISRSPLFDHVLSLDGLLTIHSFGQTGRFVDTFKSKLDENSGAMFMFHSAMRWQAVWLDLLVVAVTFFVSLFIVVLTPDRVTPANAGMALAFALQVNALYLFFGAIQ